MSFKISPEDAGEHARCGRAATSPSGSSPMPCKPPVESSPRMQGAPRQARGLVRRQGIIPADAGSTDWKTNPQTQVKDHPRGCGEHQCVD